VTFIVIKIVLVAEANWGIISRKFS